MHAWPQPPSAAADGIQGHAAPRPKPRHPRRTRRRWQRGHTLAIVVIEAVFHAAMFVLNAVASLNACGPSGTLAKSPHCISPEPRRVSPVHCARAPSEWAECVRSDAAGARRSRCGATAAVGAGAKPERASVLSVVHTIILEE
jgi:hypothetical protein